MSLSMILKFFFNFGRFEPCDSYKLYSYKKESVYSLFMGYLRTIYTDDHFFGF